MQIINDLECPICLQLCKNAVESACCAHAFCQNCIYSFLNKKCPFCQTQNFKVAQSKILRRVISNIKVQCPNKQCQKKISHGDLDKHVLICQFTPKRCIYCNQSLKYSQLYQHTLQVHSQQAKKIILKAQDDFQKQQTKLKTASLLRIEQQFNPLATVRNRLNKEAGLGEKQKYYCGGQLGLKCICCDGNCGPTNGQNCTSCMQLDIKLRKLPKGYLVNSNGKIAKITQNKIPYCGSICQKLDSTSHYQCNRNNKCHSCQKLTLTIQRYAQFL